MSFQLGASLSGKINAGGLPIHYSLAVVNGNNKNKAADDNSGKQYTMRTLFTLSKKYQLDLGLNAGAGDVADGNVRAWGVDISTKIQLSSVLILDLQAEAKQANNHILYQSQENPGEFNDYQMRGVYVLPYLRYALNLKHLQAIEASFKYEYMDPNYKLNSNAQQTYTPMVGAELMKNYGVRIQLGLQIDRYKQQLPNSATYNGNLLILQLQTRF